MNDPGPIVRDNRPTCLPLRGPLNAPHDISDLGHMESFLTENYLLLGTVRDLVNRKAVFGSGSLLEDALPLMQTLQRNLIYLAIKAELHDNDFKDPERCLRSTPTHNGEF